MNQASNSMQAYLQSLYKFPRLTHKELCEAYTNMHATTTTEGEKERLRNMITQCNLRLVVSVAKTYNHGQFPMLDLVQEGNIGLMKAVERFDHTRGYQFSTFATWWIRQAIGQYVQKHKRTIRMPSHALTAQKRLLQATQEFREEFGVEPTEAEVFDRVSEISETVKKATMFAGRGTVSLEAPAYIAGKSSSNGPHGETTIGSTIEDHTPGSDPFLNCSDAEIIKIVREVMHHLPPKEAAIIRLRFGLVEEKTNHEKYPVTQEEVDGISNGVGLEDASDNDNTA